MRQRERERRRETERDKEGERNIEKREKKTGRTREYKSRALCILQKCFSSAAGWGMHYVVHVSAGD